MVMHFSSVVFRILNRRTPMAAANAASTAAHEA